MDLKPGTRISHSDPGAAYLAHRAEIDSAVLSTLASRRYILGEQVAAFEKEWATYVGTAAAVGVGTGTDAIELALRALGVGVGDTVITVANTAVATVSAIERAGASALLVDVDEGTRTMSPRALEEAISAPAGRRVKAVIPVHLYGQPADLPAIAAIAKQRALSLIEDCAQAHGAKIDGRSVGTWGVAAAFSFYPTKNLGALGDGGAVVSNDLSLAERMRELRMYGWRERYISDRAGISTRLDELQAAILRVKLRYLEQSNERRRELAELYYRQLQGLPIRLPSPGENVRHVYHQFVIDTSERDKLREHLEALMIGTAVLYPVPIHLQPGYQGRIAVSGSLSVAERNARELLCLPMHPSLADDDVAQVANAIRTRQTPMPESTNRGMSAAEIDTMRSVEDDLWWFRALRRHVLANIPTTSANFELLDAGCGTGGMLSRVRERFPDAVLTGLDFSERALELTGQRGINARLVQGSTDDLPFAEGQFDVVLSLDVIVLHGVDDHKAVCEMHRVLRPGGKLIMNVAAFDFLRGSHDVATNMARRYTRPRLARLLHSAGFSDHRISYWNMSLLPAIAAVRWASRHRAPQPQVRSDLKPIWPPFNAALAAVAHGELSLSHRLALPFGTSLFATAQR